MNNPMMNTYSIVSKTYMQTGTVFTVLLVAVFFGGTTHLAQSSDDRFSISRIPPAPEVISLIESGDFPGAEQLAREKGIDARIIAILSLKNGKKDVAFTILSDFISEAPEDSKRELADQAVGMLRHSTSAELGDEFLNFLIDNEVLILNNYQMMVAEIPLLIRAGKLEEAEHKVNLLLDSPYTEYDLVDLVITFISVVNSNDIELNPERDIRLYEMLLKKFPNNLRVKYQWISRLTAVAPAKSLVELDLLYANLQDFSDPFFRESDALPAIRYLRARAFENLGERDRAKSEYSALIGTDFEDSARNKINNLEEWERVERKMDQELREKIAQAYTDAHQPHELPARPSRPWGLILGGNAVIIAIIIYLFYWRGRKKV